MGTPLICLNFQLSYGSCRLVANVLVGLLGRAGSSPVCLRRKVPLMARDETTVIAQLRSSHDRLVRELETLGEVGLAEPSACPEWSVGRVVAHLGSGAEIASMTLEAALAGSDQGAGQEAMGQVWQRYDALGDTAATERSISANETLLDRLESLTPDQQETLVVPFFTGPKPLPIFGAFRLAEHAVHTWDVAVTREPADELAPEMAQIVLDAVVAPMVGRLASNPGPGESVVGVHLSDTGRSLVLELDPTVGLRAPRPGEAPEARLDISTAAFVRLVYGRLDADHTPDSVAPSDAAVLDQLRLTFPGF